MRDDADYTGSTFFTNLGLLLGRLALGGMMFPHGAQKLFGWFGGPGPTAVVKAFSGDGIPPLFAWLAIIAESLGALGVIFGVLPRTAAFGILCTMAVAVARVHWVNGFWNSNKGIELHILVIGLCLVTIFTGPGRWTLLPDLEARLFRRRR